MPYPQLSYYTYHDERFCIECNSPIPDQISKLRKFCPTYMLPDGTKVNCKDRYHSPKTKKYNAPYKRIADFHKKTHQSLMYLWKAKGPHVTEADLNQYGIRLNRCVEYEADENQIWTFYYVGYAITLTPAKKYKITQHARVF